MFTFTEYSNPIQSIVEFQGKIIFVPHITYIDEDDNYLEIHFDNGDHLFFQNCKKEDFLNILLKKDS